MFKHTKPTIERLREQLYVIRNKMCEPTKPQTQVLYEANLQSGEGFKRRSDDYLLPGILNRRRAVANVALYSSGVSTILR
jgi:hypothetical protein